VAEVAAGERIPIRHTFPACCASATSGVTKALARAVNRKRRRSTRERYGRAGAGVKRVRPYRGAAPTSEPVSAAAAI